MMKVKLFFLLLSVSLIGSCGDKSKGERTKTPEATDKAATTGPKMMIVARLSVKPERVKDFIEAAKEMIEKSNKEAGCSFYQLYQDPYGNSGFVVVEEYENQAAVDAHFASEYFKAFGPKIGDMILGPPEIKIITVAKEEVR